MSSKAALDKNGNLIERLSHRPHDRQDPASTTKLWTLNTLIEIHDREPGGWNKFYKENENAIKRMMVFSDNGAANMLAKKTSGSIEAFTDEMNCLAVAAGATGTNFKTVDGMPHKEHYSTAHDMAKLMHSFREEHPDQFRLAGIEQHKDYNRKGAPIRYNTGSALLGENGIVGFKTGTAHGVHGDYGNKAGVGATENGGTFCVLGASGTGERNSQCFAMAKGIEGGAIGTPVKDKPVAAEGTLVAAAKGSDTTAKKAEVTVEDGSPKIVMSKAGKEVVVDAKATIASSDKLLSTKTQKGRQTEDTAAVHAFLKTYMGFEIKENEVGHYGAKTTAVVDKMQELAGITDDGKVGKDTRRVMLGVMNGDEKLISALSKDPEFKVALEKASQGMKDAGSYAANTPVDKANAVTPSIAQRTERKVEQDRSGRSTTSPA